MQDKEVGDLWRKATLPVVFELIEKIVRERTSYYKIVDAQRMSIFDNRDMEYYENLTRRALVDFGIDPKAWFKEK